MKRSEPYSLSQLVHTTHINDVYSGRKYLPEDKALAEAKKASVVLWLRIDEPQGEGLLVWHRGEELPRLLYFKS